jgi:hypothetical protein
MQTRALHRVWRVVLSHQALMALVLASVRASFYSSTLSFTLKLNSRHDESRSANWTSHGRRPRVTQGVGCRAEADTPLRTARARSALGRTRARTADLHTRPGAHLSPLKRRILRERQKPAVLQGARPALPAYTPRTPRRARPLWLCGGQGEDPRRSDSADRLSWYCDCTVHVCAVRFESL